MHCQCGLRRTLTIFLTESIFVQESPQHICRSRTGKPVHVATEDIDLTAKLKRGISFVRQKKPPRQAKSHCLLAS
jgi:hypothetical protein